MRIQRKPVVTIAYMGGVPVVPEPFCWSLARLVQHSIEALDFQVDLQRARLSYHAAARNGLAATMRGDWLFTLDTDHEFEPDTLARLLNSAQRLDADVISGFYRYRSQPHAPVAYLWSDQPGLANPIGWWEPGKPVFQVDATGGGCLLVHRRIFDMIRAELGEDPFDPRRSHRGGGPVMGEDLSFFDRLHQLGVPAWLDTSIRADHLRWAPVKDEDFMADACVFGQERTLKAA